MSLEIDSYTVYKHRKICICMTKCRAGFATAYKRGNGIIEDRKRAFVFTACSFFILECPYPTE